MKQFLAIGFALTLSVSAIGSPPEPDRQNPDQIVLVEQAAIGQAFIIDITLLSLPESILITEQEADFTSLFLVSSGASLGDIAFDIEFAEASLTAPLLTIIQLGDEVVEKTHKARDRYRLPIWDYLPLVEPPSTNKSLNTVSRT